jgi:hypothetical protein
MRQLRYARNGIAMLVPGKRLAAHPQGSWRSLPGAITPWTRKHQGLICRLLLVPLFVAVCHIFDWYWLRILLTITIVKISALLAIPMHRIGVDLVELGGMQMRFAVSCTLLDAFFGAVPLLWQSSVSVRRNFAHLAVVWIAMSGLNVVRLEAGFVAMNAGAPWWLAHECVSGVSYFCLFLYIVHRRFCSIPSSSRDVVG